MSQYSDLFTSLGKKISEDVISIFSKGKKILTEKRISECNSLYPENCAKALGPYSPAMDTGDFIFFSGQIALDSDGNFCNNSLESESEQVFKNIDALLVSAQCTKENIVKVTVFLDDLENFSAFNTLYEQYLGAHKPARSCVQVVLPKNARVEVEVIVKR